jgi:HAD superfamily hydrolase (TIGR01662 family)
VPDRSSMHDRRRRRFRAGRREADAVSRCVFVDRDGTLIEEVGYLDRVERVTLYPWTADAIRALNRAGLKIVLVSNQSGIARGFFTEAVVDEVHRHMARCRPAARISTRITIARITPTAR